MQRAIRLSAFVFSATVSLAWGETPSDCRTPSGVRCRTVQERFDQWSIRGGDSYAVDHYRIESTIAYSKDGSIASQTVIQSGGLFRDGMQSQGKSLYLAPQGQEFKLDPDKGTYTVSPAKYSLSRRSKEYDRACITGIIHQGTDLRQEETTTILGLPAVHWTRALANGGYEDFYLAPDLDCQPLKQRRVDKNQFHIPKFIQTREVTSIDWNPPEPQLFQPPREYQQLPGNPDTRLYKFLQAVPLLH